MFEPIRGGTRGGQAEFKWSDVSADKDREVRIFPNILSSSQHPPSLQNYLGHSINAPTGRWQKNKDVHWYNRDQKLSEEERAEEIRKVKEAEAEALSVALYASLVIHLPFLDIHSHTQWFWTIKEGIIVKHTRHGHKCDTHPSLNSGE
jgi:hypothetical protein